MTLFSKYVLALALLALTSVSAAFYDCIQNIQPLKSDTEALALIKTAFTQKLKFPSQCLEILLKKNFLQTGEYLINEYYPKTSIDTEVIVKNVANEIKRSQDYLIF